MTDFKEKMKDFKEKTVLTLKAMVDNKMVVNHSMTTADKDDFDFDDFLYLINNKIVNDNFISGKYQLTECG